MTSTYAFSTEDDIRRVVNATRQVERTPQFRPRKQLRVPVATGGGGNAIRKYQIISGHEGGWGDVVFAVPYEIPAGIGRRLLGSEITQIFSGGYQDFQWENGASVGKRKIYVLSVEFWGNPTFIGQLCVGNSERVISGPVNESFTLTLAAQLEPNSSAEATITTESRGIVLDGPTGVPRVTVVDTTGIVPATNLASGTIVTAQWSGTYDGYSGFESTSSTLLQYDLVNAACPVVE